jgi:ABC-type transport system substrate-binding protein
MVGKRGVLGFALALLPGPLALVIACGAAAKATPVPPTPTAAPPAAKAAVPAPPGATATPVPTATARPTPAPTTPPKAKIERLKVAIIPLAHETSLPWMMPITSQAHIRQMYEYLTEVDRSGKGFKPMLATEWQMAPDAKSWTIKLRKDVPFHFGGGSFSSKDIPFIAERLTSDKAIATNTGPWRGLLGTNATEVLDRVKVVDDQTVTFSLKRPEPELNLLFLNSEDFAVLSKAQWDKEGEEGVQRKPVGTGPYQFKERKLGSHILYERVPYRHWRVNPEFKELQLIFAPEDATRLAMLLAGEAHIVELSRTLHKDAVAKGMKVVTATYPATPFFIVLGGQFRPDNPSYDAALPWHKREVRQALSMAINRDEMVRAFYGSQAAQRHIVGVYHPLIVGWNPDWDKRFSEFHGYNPAKAKALLEQAGYAKGFDIQLVIAPREGVPEIKDVNEAVANYWNAVGVRAKLVEMDFSTLRGLYVAFKTSGMAWTHVALFREQIARTLFIAHHSKGVVHYYDSEFLDKAINTLNQTVNPSEREGMIRDIGNHLFEETATIPLFWTIPQFVTNPHVVKEFVTTGRFLPDLEYVKAAP